MFSIFFIALQQFFCLEIKYAKQANAYMNQKEFYKAEYDYKKSLGVNSRFFEANYNLANAFFSQKSYNDAAAQYLRASDFAPDDRNKARTFHNLGNALLRKKDYAQALDAYKNALRKNPKDNQTRYNLAYTLEKLKNKDKDKKQRSQNKELNKQQNALPNADELLKKLAEQERNAAKRFKENTSSKTQPNPKKDW